MGYSNKSFQAIPNVWKELEVRNHGLWIGFK